MGEDGNTEVRAMPTAPATPEPSPAVSALRGGIGIAAHTPGPWPVDQAGDGKRYIVGKGLVEGPNGYDVAEVYADDCPLAEAEANARLIAKAPTMAEALTRIATLCPGDFGHPVTGEVERGAVSAAMRDIAREALASTDRELEA